MFFSMFFGNLFVFFQFKDAKRIDEDTRTVVFIVLGVVAAVGVVFMCVLRPARSADGSLAPASEDGPIQALKNSLKLFATKEMILLTFTFFYTGKSIYLWS